MVVIALVFGVLFMHGGLGSTSCAGTTMSGMDTASETQLAIHHVPALPRSHSDVQMNAGCVAPLPDDGFVLGGLLLIGIGLTAAASGGNPLPLKGRTGGREPPRPRRLDPTNGLGILRI